MKSSELRVEASFVNKGGGFRGRGHLTKALRSRENGRRYRWFENQILLIDLKSVSFVGGGVFGACRGVTSI